MFLNYETVRCYFRPVTKTNYFVGYVSKEEKENINILEEEKALEVPSKRRPLQSSTLQVSYQYPSLV